MFGSALGSTLISNASAALGVGYFIFGPTQDPFHKLNAALFQLCLSLLFFALLESPVGLVLGILINMVILGINLYKVLMAQTRHQKGIHMGRISSWAQFTMAAEPDKERAQEIPVWRTTLKQIGIFGLVLLALRLVAGLLYSAGVLPL